MLVSKASPIPLNNQSVELSKDSSGAYLKRERVISESVNNGVTGVAIVDARTPHACLFEIFTDKGAGTLIRK